MDSGLQITMQVIMKIVILILAVLPAALSTERCETCIYGRCQYIELIHESPIDITLVNVLAVDYTARIIYCEFKHNNFGTFFGGYWENRTLKKFGYMKEPIRATVDQNSHDVYVSSLEENFKFNPVMTPTYTLTDYLYKIPSTIEDLQYQKKLYFSYSHINGIYSLGDNTLYNIRPYSIDEDEKYFIVDKKHRLYFKSKHNLYMDYYKTTSLSIKRFNNSRFNLSMDAYGTVYVKADKYLYKIANLDAEEIGYFAFPTDFKPVFDWNNNILFVDLGKLFVIKPSFPLLGEHWCSYTNGTITRVCKKCDATVNNNDTVVYLEQHNYTVL